MADALRKEPGFQVELVDGNNGEFTVLVNGQAVARKGEALPPIDEVLGAVKKTAPTAVG